MITTDFLLLDEPSKRNF